MLGSLSGYQQAQYLASQDLVSYKAVGRTFPACVGPTKEYTAML